MAPELFRGLEATEATDQFALGVTIYRLFTGRFPYGEIEPFTHPKFRSPSLLANYRPDLPAWLDKVIGRAISLNATDRYRDVLELIFELEHGADRASPVSIARMPFYQRNPLLFWKITSVALALLLAASLFLTMTKNGAGNAKPAEGSTVQQSH